MRASRYVSRAVHELGLCFSYEADPTSYELVATRTRMLLIQGQVLTDCMSLVASGSLCLYVACSVCPVLRPSHVLILCMIHVLFPRPSD
jgi:hypothetical protein